MMVVYRVRMFLRGMSSGWDERQPIGSVERVRGTCLCVLLYFPSFFFGLEKTKGKGHLIKRAVGMHLAVNLNEEHPPKQLKGYKSQAKMMSTKSAPDQNSDFCGRPSARIDGQAPLCIDGQCGPPGKGAHEEVQPMPHRFPFFCLREAGVWLKAVATGLPDRETEGTYERIRESERGHTSCSRDAA